MTYYPDLYLFDRDPETRKIGWLDADHGYSKAVPSEELLDALWQFAKAPVCGTRGFHECELCPRAPDYHDRIEDIRARMRDPNDPLHRTAMRDIPWPQDERRQSVEAERGGERLLLGTAEIRAYGANGVLYAAPTLIYHYVAMHHYQPPDEFVRAAMTGPRPPGDDYRALLRRFEIR